ncbi:hypothetical protein NDU88_005314 [Pleurodeles waltl]|uniref:Uncharacterized protein n=1 Tax=Pleurodeles waltl TaxID=8319 RepID=A0AAV7WX97_PLEWA|nr:hypothetical protein NDU88_005314 [Pleurodeles waltl]
MRPRFSAFSFSHLLFKVGPLLPRYLPSSFSFPFATSAFSRLCKRISGPAPQELQRPRQQCGPVRPSHISSGPRVVSFGGFSVQFWCVAPYTTDQQDRFKDSRNHGLPTASSSPPQWPAHSKNRLVAAGAPTHPPGRPQVSATHLGGRRTRGGREGQSLQLLSAPSSKVGFPPWLEGEKRGAQGRPPFPVSEAGFCISAPGWPPQPTAHLRSVLSANFGLQRRHDSLLVTVIESVRAGLRSAPGVSVPRSKAFIYSPGTKALAAPDHRAADRRNPLLPPPCLCCSGREGATGCRSWLSSGRTQLLPTSGSEACCCHRPKALQQCVPECLGTSGAPITSSQRPGFTR